MLSCFNSIHDAKCIEHDCITVGYPVIGVCRPPWHLAVEIDVRLSRSVSSGISLFLEMGFHGSIIVFDCWRWRDNLIDMVDDAIALFIAFRTCI